MTDEALRNDVARRALREYRILKKLLGLLHEFVAGGETLSATMLDRELRVLRMHLEQHFLLEEQGGLFDDIRTRIPAAASSADTLKREHPEFVRELDGLTARLEGGTEADIEALRGDLGAFLERLGRHEESENELFQRAYNLDEAPVD